MSARSRQAAVELPKVNTAVVIGIDDGELEFPSRVEDLSGDFLCVAAVPVPNGIEIVRPGLPLSVSWSQPRGLLTVNCVLDQYVRDTPPMWVVLPVGPTRLRQRRRFARADVMGRAEIAAATADGPAGRVPGQLADLSEGGARIIIDTGELNWFCAGDPVEVTLHLTSGSVHTMATLLGLDRTSNGRVQVRLEFELTESDGGVVRREVMRRQMEMRRRGDD